MTDRPFPLTRGLRGNGQAQGPLPMWWGLVAFCVGSPVSIAATNMAWVVALVGLLYYAPSRDVRFDSLVRRTDLDVPLIFFVLASLLSVFLSLDIVSSVVEFRSLGLMVIFFLFTWRGCGPWARGRPLCESSCFHPVWQRQVCGCLAFCVGYHFAQGVWSGKQWAGVAEWVGWVGLAGFVALFLGCCLLLKGYLRRHAPSILVDLAGIGALLTGAVIALVTDGLLRMAAQTESLRGPPYLPAILLASLGAALYSAARFACRGDREQRILLVALGLCTLIHVFL